MPRNDRSGQFDLKSRVNTNIFTLKGFQYLFKCSVGIREGPVFLNRMPTVAADGLDLYYKDRVVRKG